MVSEVTEPTILMSTRADGLFEVNDQTRRHKIIGQSVRALAPDGFEGALVMVGGRELGQRAPNGHWMTGNTSEFERACCIAVGDRNVPNVSLLYLRSKNTLIYNFKER